MAGKCGTYAGWNQHRHRGTKPCDDCNSAQASYVRELRIRSGYTKNMLVPVWVLRNALASLDAWVVLYEYLGPDLVDAIKHAPEARSEATT